jgi:hypothetical protein
LIPINNESSRYVLADLNNLLVALASQKNDKHESELYVLHIGAWDRDSRDWSVTMSGGEVIETVAVGQEFVAIYTDLRFVRIYTASGITRLVFSVPGILYYTLF